MEFVWPSHGYCGHLENETVDRISLSFVSPILKEGIFSAFSISFNPSSNFVRLEASVIFQMRKLCLMRCL